VLVHGAWHGPWCWNKLAPVLEAQGHRVTAVELPGRRGDAAELASLKLDHFVASVVQVLDASPRPVVLVGHSLGGATISLVAEARPDKIKTLTYLTAFMVPAGMTVGSIAMTDKETWIPKVVQRDAGTGVSRLNPAHVREVFYQDCSDEDVAYAQQRVTPEASTMGVTPIRTTNERFGRVDRVYIECLRDHAIGIATQRRMQSALPCRAVRTMDTRHSPFFSDAQGLAQVLIASALPG
jgi:pimeloyl-ACP methyl ester carboxylesterase